MAPTTTNADLLRPVYRFLLYEAYFDDYVEICPWKR